MVPKFATVLLTAVLALVSALPLWAQNATATDGLKPGDVLNETNWQKAEGLLPPEILKHYQSGEYANPIVDWPREKYEWPPDFPPRLRRMPGNSTSMTPGRSSRREAESSRRTSSAFRFRSSTATTQGRHQDAVEQLLCALVLRHRCMPSRSSIGSLPRALERRGDVIADFEYYDGVPEDIAGRIRDNFNARFLGRYASHRRISTALRR